MQASSDQSGGLSNVPLGFQSAMNLSIGTKSLYQRRCGALHVWSASEMGFASCKTSVNLQNCFSGLYMAYRVPRAIWSISSGFNRKWYMENQGFNHFFWSEIRTGTAAAPCNIATTRPPWRWGGVFLDDVRTPLAWTACMKWIPYHLWNLCVSSRAKTVHSYAVAASNCVVILLFQGWL